MATCTRLDHIRDMTRSFAGYRECLAAGGHDWVHLRVWAPPASSHH